MTKRRKIVLLVIGLYALGLIWGQVRLPLAAIKSMADYPLLRGQATLSAPPGALVMPGIQEWYLRRSLHIVNGAQPPRITAEVKWNWGIVARVNTSLYFSPTGAEWLDCVYVCLFGWWVPVHVFSHIMA